MTGHDATSHDDGAVSWQPFIGLMRQFRMAFTKKEKKDFMIIISGPGGKGGRG